MVKKHLQETRRVKLMKDFKIEILKFSVNKLKQSVIQERQATAPRCSKEYIFWKMSYN